MFSQGTFNKWEQGSRKGSLPQWLLLGTLGGKGLSHIQRTMQSSLLVEPTMMGYILCRMLDNIVEASHSVISHFVMAYLATK